MKFVDLFPKAPSSLKLKPMSSSRSLGKIKKMPKNGKDPYDTGDRNTDESIEIYAELSKRQSEMIRSGNYGIEIPYGVNMTNRPGSRCLYFICDGKESAQELMEGLDASQISWQEN